MDTDLAHIDFPMLSDQIKLEGFASLLSEELQTKLNLKEFAYFEDLTNAEPQEQSPGPVTSSPTACPW